MYKSCLLNNNIVQLSLVQEVANIKAKHVSTLEAFVLDKFKLVGDIERRGKETEGIHEWLSRYTAKATDKVGNDLSFFCYSNLYSTHILVRIKCF